MKEWLFPTLCGGAFILSAFPSHPDEQRAARSATSARLDLENISAEFAKTDEQMRQKADALITLVDQEAAGKRIPEYLADGLRSAAVAIKDPAYGEPRTLLANAHLPLANGAVMRAVHDAEDEAIAVQSRREELIIRAITETRRRTRMVAFHATTSADVEPFIHLVASLAADALAHSPSEDADRAARTFYGCAGFLRSVSGALLGVEKHDALAAGASIREIYRNQGAEGIVHYDLEALANRIEARLEIAVEKKRHFLESAMVERKSAAEVHAALDLFEEAANFCVALGPPNFTDRHISRMYRKVVEVWDELGKPATPLIREDIEEVRKIAGEIPWPEDTRYFMIRDRLDEWEKEFDKVKAKGISEQRESLLATLRAVKEAPELMALAQGIEQRASAEETAGSSEDANRKAALSAMATGFARLAGAWKAGSLSLSEFQINTGIERNDQILGREWSRLLERIERNVLSRTLKAPELNLFPLASQSLRTALETLRDIHANRGEWTRVLLILSILDTNRNNAESSSWDKEASATVRSFLAGENFELAEQWAEAAAEYKAVLRSAIPRTPVREAAERLKFLRNEHLLSEP